LFPLLPLFPTGDFVVAGNNLRVVSSNNKIARRKQR